MIRKLNTYPEKTVYDEMETPVGNLMLVASDSGLHAILWETEKTTDFPHSKNNKIILETKRQLAEYFSGTRTTFDLPLAPHGTPFQLKTLEELRKIPYGETISYGEQAKRLGDKNKARAVGMANGQNPISIIVPCHRVIGSNGSLTGFGGGLNCKQWLLDHEKNILNSEEL